MRGHVPWTDRAGDGDHTDRRYGTRAIDPGGHPLSPRETQVYDLLARGATDVQIGRELGIAASSVKNHVRSIKLKRRVYARMDLVVLYYGGHVYRREPRGRTRARLS